MALSDHPRLPGTGWDKLNHVLAFATLVCIGKLGWPRRTWTAAATLLTFGLLIEILQSFTATREADWKDLVADITGILSGRVVLWVVRLSAART